MFGISKLSYSDKTLFNVPLEPENATEFKLDKKQDSPTTRKLVKLWKGYAGLISALSNNFNVETKALLAVIAIESLGKGYDKNGRLVIRFEIHQFWRNCGKKNPELFNMYFTFNKDKPWRKQQFRQDENSAWESYHGSQDREWRVLELAMRLNKDKALYSTSMGMPQIYGSQHKIIGYSTVNDIFFSISEKSALSNYCVKSLRSQKDIKMFTG